MGGNLPFIRPGLNGEVVPEAEVTLYESESAADHASKWN
jgi:hypothetical protein